MNLADIFYVMQGQMMEDVWHLVWEKGGDPASIDCLASRVQM